MTHEKDPPDNSRHAASEPGLPDTPRRRIELRTIIGAALPTRNALSYDHSPDQGLHHDIVLFEALQAEIEKEAFEGFLWLQTADQLARYGLGVIKAWVDSGSIYKKLTEIGRSVTPLLVPFTHEERDDLTKDVVIAGLKQFQKVVLIERAWDPSRGAGLATYFIRLCLGAFSNIYRSYDRKRRKRIGTEVLSGDLDAFLRTVPSAEHIGTARMALLEAIERVPPGADRAIIVLTAIGYSDSEIAELFGDIQLHMTKSGVRSKRLHARRRWFARIKREGEHDA
ncbi:hypothetical protein [Amycolatopsis sp. NPDC004625]|uniref:RNA polymerase sigma factor n=1 Tax=Amycolatopsis sp. NPDC004625 TaxID=3154670 RepID=UPI0033B2B87C